MRLSSGAPAQHLSYCTNIHPGETLSEVRTALATFVPTVKAEVAPNAPFGVGLRLSQCAAEQLLKSGELAALRGWLDDHGLYVFTLNGFPYGAFHGARVKERVYEPDWRSPARVSYTAQLAAALAGLLPDGVAGSISTVPGAWRASLASVDELSQIADHVLASVATLIRISEESGRRLALAIEPEPGCVLETIEEAVEFFRRHLFDERATRRVAELAGLSTARAAASLREHVGLCLDACHAAVEFEEPQQLMATLRAAGVGVNKLQISSGLRVSGVNSEALAALAAFAEDTYLHQTVERRHGKLTRFRDLPEALASAREPGWDSGAAEWRVHFHVPIFIERYGVLESTQGFLRELLALHRTTPISDHLEVETYTWDVLPAGLRGDSVTTAISRELQFVLRELGDASSEVQP